MTKKEYDRARYLSKREEINERNKRWNKENRDHLREYQRYYREVNPEKIKQMKDNWKTENPQAYSLYTRRHRAKLTPEERMYRNSKSGAKKRGIEFSIELEDIIIPNCCPITNQVFSNEDRANWPSLDRIDNTKGYVKGNVRVISMKANTNKGNLTLEEIKNLYLYSIGEL